MQREEHRQERHMEVSAADYLKRLQKLALTLSGALTVEQVAEAIVAEGLEALGANVGVVAVLSEDTEEVLTLRSVGYSPEVVQAYERYSLQAPFPTAEAIRTQQPIFLQSLQERTARYPHLAAITAQDGRKGALVILPLANGHVVGAVALSFPTDRAFNSEEREFMQSIAHLCGLALERARLYDAERRALQQARQELQERQQTQAALCESEERFRRMVESIHDYALILFDTTGQITHWNSGAQRIFGYRPEEILGQPGCVLFTPEDVQQGLPQQEFERAERDGKAADDRWHVRKDGTRLWMSGSLMLMRDEEGHPRGFVKVARDLTQRRRAEEEQLRAYAKIAEQEREFAVVAERTRIAREIHDTLAQGLTGIRIHLEVAEKLLRAAPDKARSHLQLARELAGQSLEAARRSVHALRAPLLEHATLDQALSDLARMMNAGLSVRVRFHLQGAPRPLPYELERTLLRIGQEALANALRHAHASQITLELAYGADQVQLRVRDDGVGLGAGPLTPGSAFGLAGMRERAEQSGGHLQINSRPNAGTEVIATLPLPLMRSPEEEV